GHGDVLSHGLRSEQRGPAPRAPVPTPGIAHRGDRLRGRHERAGLRGHSLAVRDVQSHAARPRGPMTSSPGAVRDSVAALGLPRETLTDVRSRRRTGTLVVVLVLLAYTAGAVTLAWVRMPQSDEGHAASAGWELAYHQRLAMPMWSAWIPSLDRSMYI